MRQDPWTLKMETASHNATIKTAGMYRLGCFDKLFLSRLVDERLFPRVRASNTWAILTRFWVLSASQAPMTSSRTLLSCVSGR